MIYFSCDLVPCTSATVFSRNLFTSIWTEPWRASLCAWSLHKGPNQGHQQRSQVRLRVLWRQGHLTMISRHRTLTKQNDEIRWCSYVQLTSIDLWSHSCVKAQCRKTLLDRATAYFFCVFFWGGCVGAGAGLANEQQKHPSNVRIFKLCWWKSELHIKIRYVNMDICAFLLKSLICVYYLCVCVSLLVQKCID